LFCEASTVKKVLELARPLVEKGLKALLDKIDVDVTSKELWHKFLTHRNCVKKTRKHRHAKAERHRGAGARSETFLQ
jgi:hypothetical protein